MKLAFAAATAMTAIFILGAPAHAGAKLGALTCYSEGSTGYVLGSSENLNCVFDPANGALPEERYIGTLDTYGIDIGTTGRTQYSWYVLAGSFDAFEPSSLAGNYYGANAEATAIVGGGANLLVGGPRNGFTLQPLSVQGQTGLNAAAGLAHLALAPAAPALAAVVIATPK